MTPDPARDFERLLDHLHRTRGFDFSSYKHASLRRRMDKRLQAVDVGDYTRYMDYLEAHPDEFGTLFDTILINVTGFLRDPEAWDVIRTEVVPAILERRRPDDAIRVWSAGCASGEEAFSLAMLFAEAMGPKAFRSRVKIYATDVDEHALAQARQATYADQVLESVSPELRARYFTRAGTAWVFDKELRRSVIFGRHDLLQDAPISRVDMLACRNALMYFNVQAQSRVLSRFYFALREDGFLFLGKAETLLAQNLGFSSIDLKRRIFAKVGQRALRDATPLVPSTATAGEPDHQRLLDAAAENTPVAMVLVDSNGVLVQANHAARELFGLGAGDVGRPLQDLELSYRPVELRSCLEAAYTDRLPVVRKDLHWPRPTGDHYLDVCVTPHFHGINVVLGASISYADVTRRHQLERELRRSNQELETALEGLQTTNEDLQPAHEERSTIHPEARRRGDMIDRASRSGRSTRPTH